MFTREALRSRLPGLLTAPVPLDVVRFDSRDFDPPDAEETIEIYRAPSGCDPMRMWASMAARRWPVAPERLHELLEATVCRPLSEPELNQVVAERAAGLVRPL